jgi:serpin B
MLGLSALALQLSGCASAGDTGLVISSVGRAPQGDPVRSTLSTFAAKMLDAMPEGNVVLSPASIAVVLAMLGNGAATTSRTQFQKDTSITFSNALWIQKGGTFKKPFLDSLKKWYGAGARAADFEHNPAAAVDTINAWCKSATKGLIPTIVDNSMITMFTQVVAGNAVHIKGSWATPFMKGLTSKAPFRTGSGRQASADMMHGTPYLRYLQTSLLTSIALPFRHPDLAFIVAVPASGSMNLTGLPDLCDVLDTEPGEINLSLPKFHAEFSQSLKSALIALGLVDAWVDGEADLSGMTADRSLFLSFVQHKAVLAVDELGAEGAAVTAGGASASSMPGTTLVVDQPFFWAIAHVPTKTLVMLGREDDPTL